MMGPCSDSASPPPSPPPDEALPGRDSSPWTLGEHVVLKTPVVTDDVPDGHEVAIFGLGCFWGAEEIYWQVPASGRRRSATPAATPPHPSYEEVCSGRTGHTEAVRIVFDPAVVSYADLVKKFFEIHDPTQGMRQGNDVGTQYRSALYVTSPEQEATARELTKVYGDELARRRLGSITTEIRPASEAPATTTPRTSTSSTSRRTRSATAATPTPGCGSPRRPDQTFAAV